MASIPRDLPAEVADLPGRSVLVLYGSETGNSQDVAEELGKIAQRLHFKTKVEEMNSISLNELLCHTLLILVISTTGQGDMPQNSLLFWKSLLRKKLPPSCLAKIRFTSFGLGDSSYIKFNWAARKLHKRIEQLGATEFYPRGEGDEQDDDGIDQSFIRWSADLKAKILEQFPLPNGLSPIPAESLLPPRYTLYMNSDAHGAGPALIPRPDEARSNSRLAALSINGEAAANHEAGSGFQIPANGTVSDELVDCVPDGVLAILEKNERVTPSDHWQDVRRLKFRIHGPLQGGLSINPGDCLRLYPRNFPGDVGSLIELMKWESVADVPLDLHNSRALPAGLYSHRFTSLRQLLTDNIDITAIPRRSFLEAISHHSIDESHKERLLEFTKSEYIDEYYDYATRPRRSILEVLQEFHSVQVPPEYLFDVFPVIRGRDFSIASITALPDDDSAAYRVELLAALVKYRTVLRKVRVGLCSRFLDPLAPGVPVLATHKPALTGFHGPKNARRPLCALATGTGIAPVHALVQERLRFNAAGTSMGRTLLFFGNRAREKDFFFHEEWADVRSDNFHLFTAFSRDQRQKVYVQDVVRQQAKAVAQLAQQDAIFVVCGGSSKMATACREAVVESLLTEGVCSTEDEAREYFKKLTWWQEIW